MSSLLLTSADAARTLRSSPAMVRWYARQGRLHYTRWPQSRLLRIWAAGLVDDAPTTLHGVLGIPDVAQVLRVHHEVVYELARGGHLPMSRRLFGWGISGSALLAWLRHHSEGEHDRELVRRLRATIYFTADLDGPLSTAVRSDP